MTYFSMSPNYGNVLSQDNMPNTRNGLLVIPDSIDSVRNDSFKGCERRNIQEIMIPPNVGRIESGAFLHCSKLKKITLHGWKATNVHGGSLINKSEIYHFRITNIGQYTIFLEGEEPKRDTIEICTGWEFQGSSSYSLSTLALMRTNVEGINGIYGSGSIPEQAHWDLYFRLKKSKHKQQYKKLNADSLLCWEEAVSMFHIISQYEGDLYYLKNLIDYLSDKPKWTIREVIDAVTKCDYAWNDIFANFFGISVKSNMQKPLIAFKKK